MQRIAPDGRDRHERSPLLPSPSSRLLLVALQRVVAIAPCDIAIRISWRQTNKETAGRSCCNSLYS